MILNSSEKCTKEHLPNVDLGSHPMIQTQVTGGVFNIPRWTSIKMLPHGSFFCTFHKPGPEEHEWLCFLILSYISCKYESYLLYFTPREYESHSVGTSKWAWEMEYEWLMSPLLSTCEAIQLWQDMTCSNQWDMQPTPMHVQLEISPTELNEAY